ncbi:MAG: hypothetical protein C3F11_20935 [Methylocystaceae bacterium]|nr:MAG: hypothetical protein C3F11_20935 [Methylocystaceae bacterium]
MSTKRPDTTRQGRGLTLTLTLTLGLTAFEKISAVEGVRLDADSKRMFAEFDRRGMTDAQRRKAIAEKHAKKA